MGDETIRGETIRGDAVRGDAVRGPTAMVVGAGLLDAGFWFPRHDHPQPQLLWSPTGVLAVEVDHDHWVLPPSRALWIPAGTPHRTGAVRTARMHAVFLDAARLDTARLDTARLDTARLGTAGLGTARRPITWDHPTVLAVGPLLAELIRYLSRPDLGEPERVRAEGVVLDLLTPLPSAPLEVRMPTDRRAARVAELLRADPADRRGLAGFARAVDTSPRTLSRLFVAETGTTFERWRTDARMWAAVALLAEGQPVSRVAHAVGYGTASAFLAAFRRTVGTTPRGYLGGPAARRPAEPPVS